MGEMNPPLAYPAPIDKVWHRLVKTERNKKDQKVNYPNPGSRKRRRGGGDFGKKTVKLIRLRHIWRSTFNTFRPFCSPEGGENNTIKHLPF